MIAEEHAELEMPIWMARLQDWHGMGVEIYGLVTSDTNSASELRYGDRNVHLDIIPARKLWFANFHPDDRLIFKVNSKVKDEAN